MWSQHDLIKSTPERPISRVFFIKRKMCVLPKHIDINCYIISVNVKLL